jgi:hypothetical protein
MVMTEPSVRYDVRAQSGLRNGLLGEAIGFFVLAMMGPAM